MAFRIAIVFGCGGRHFQPISGDISAKDVAKRQPAKLAAMEAHFKTEKFSPLNHRRHPRYQNQEVNYAIKIAGLAQLYDL